jgi:tetratricopeptide (TPR) repeat protein
MSIRRITTGMLAIVALTATVAAQVPKAREHAQVPYNAGIAELRKEALDAAVKSFQTAVEIDPTFEMAHFMLGRTLLAQRQFAAAVVSLEKARTLYTAQGTERFSDKQERQRVFRDRIAHIDELIEVQRAAAAAPENKQRGPSLQEQVRQYEERKRQLQDALRNDDMNATQAVPGFVSLSLGSAYFRAGRTADAERAYLAAVAADPKIGEAHNNLAVIYMESGRLDDAERSLQAAEKAGLKVNPALKEEIKKRRKT